MNLPFILKRHFYILLLRLLKIKESRFNYNPQLNTESDDTKWILEPGFLSKQRWEEESRSLEASRRRDKNVWAGIPLSEDLMFHDSNSATEELDNINGTVMPEYKEDP